MGGSIKILKQSASFFEHRGIVPSEGILDSIVKSREKGVVVRKVILNKLKLAEVHRRLFWGIFGLLFACAKPNS